MMKYLIYRIFGGFYLNLFAVFFLVFAFSCKNSQQISPQVAINNTDNRTDSLNDLLDEAVYFSESALLYENKIYSDSIKTVQLYNNKTKEQYPELGLPLITMNTDERLTLEFDDWSATYKTYSYEIVYCNADWTPSDLSPSQYIQGFTNDFITDYQFSFNTYTSYIHYQVTFPSDYIKFLISGNYLLIVKGADDKIVFTKRFYVQENSGVSLEKMTIQPATKAEYRFTKQEVDFTLKVNENLNVVNYYDELKVIVSQNFRMDNAKVDLKPKYINNNELVYDYETENTFFGLNEFRSFDVPNFKYNTQYVKHISILKNRVEVVLVTDEQRNFRRYYQQPDLNGKFYVNKAEAENIDTESDYMLTTFKLNTVSNFNNGSIYVYGALTDWQLLPEFKLRKQGDGNLYQCSTWLKQGYYNYMYAFVPDSSKNNLDIAAIEGSFSETENDYYILVYYRQQSQNYDRLLAVFRKNSLNRY